MAKVTNAFTSYSATANREDLSNVISNIDPFDTPFMTMAGKRNVNNRTFDWQTESLPAINASNVDVEGFQLSAAAATPTVRLNNVTQISHRDATVAGTQESVDAAGKKAEMAHQMALVAKALKRDMETMLVGTQPRVSGDDSGPTARKTRGFEHFLQSNISSGTGYAYVDQYTALTDGTLRTLTETMFNDVIQSCYTNGAEPKTAMVGPAIKRKISAFTGRSGTQVPVKDNLVTNSVDIYRSDFGDIKIMPSRWSRTRTVLFIDPEYIKVAYLRPFKAVDLAIVGDAMTKMIVVEYGLECTNEKAHGKVADIQ